MLKKKTNKANMDWPFTLFGPVWTHLTSVTYGQYKVSVKSFNIHSVTVKMGYKKVFIFKETLSELLCYLY